MNCPFLQEARVRFCHAASFRKMLLQSSPAAEERCSSADFPDCPVYRGHAGAWTRPEGDRCPYLHESMVQFCAATSAPRPVPWSESTLIRCGQSGFRFCEVYLSFAHPLPAPEDTAEGIDLPRNLRYTPNHMWIDVADDGSWRIGIDGLLAHALGHVNSIEFLTGPGTNRPAAVLTSGQTEVQIAFPAELPVAATNTYLRADPGRVADAPYTSGWLFRGDRCPAEAPLPDLIPGDGAREWMLAELASVARFAHEAIPALNEGAMADGGMPERGFLNELPRPDRLRCVNTFFSPLRSGRK
jgi:glycine cleavage system H protein